MYTYYVYSYNRGDLIQLMDKYIKSVPHQKSPKYTLLYTVLNTCGILRICTNFDLPHQLPTDEERFFDLFVSELLWWIFFVYNAFLT